MPFFSLMKYFKVYLELMANLLKTLNFLRTRMIEDDQVRLCSVAFSEKPCSPCTFLKMILLGYMS
jgi:hypothetical protein